VGSKVNPAQRHQAVVNIGKLVFWLQRFQLSQDGQKGPPPYRLKDEAVTVAVDYHAVTRHLEVSRDTNGLALIVAKQLGLAAGSVILLTGLGHVDSFAYA
jgi:hypothetical protein